MRLPLSNVVVLQFALALGVAGALGCDAAEDIPELAALKAARSAHADAAAPKTDGPEVMPGRAQIASIGRHTAVHAEPRIDSRKIGYLRIGSLVHRGNKPAGQQGCQGGWYRVAPKGYVCNDQKTATLNLDHPALPLLRGGSDAALRRSATNDTSMPYHYVASRYPTPAFYGRLPTRKEQRRTEPDLRDHERKHKRRKRNKRYVAPPEPQPMPDLLKRGEVLPGLDGVDRGVQWDLGRGRRRSGFAVLANYEHEGRQYGLTTDLVLIPMDRTRPVTISPLQGIELGDDMKLPVGFVTKSKARRYEPRGSKKMRRTKTRLRRHEQLDLTGEKIRRLGHMYYETAEGDYVRSDHMARFELFRDAPVFAKGKQKWIDVSLIRQALTAYEGTTPVFVTRISSGRDGLAHYKDSYATPQGTYKINAKHITTTMDSDVEGESFQLQQVPFVQYFKDSYALHAAYWHDDFGKPRSHGCINLTPHDARWLFEWSTPDVPNGWHARFELESGTIVHIHP